MLDREQLAALLARGENESLDWKQAFPVGLIGGSTDPKWNEGKATILKDIAALANTPAAEDAYLVYGVRDDGASRTVVGISGSWDDATFQTWNRNVFDPIVSFLYNEIEWSPSQLVGIFAIKRSPAYPHVVRRTINTLAEGQVWVRRGTQNGVATRRELELMFRPVEPFKIRTASDPVINQIAEHYEAIGETPTFPSFGDKDSLIARGYRIAYYPGSRREIWMGEVGGHYEHIMMLRPSNLKF